MCEGDRQIQTATGKKNTISKIIIKQEEESRAEKCKEKRTRIKFYPVNEKEKKMKKRGEHNMKRKTQKAQQKENSELLELTLIQRSTITLANVERKSSILLKQSRKEKRIKSAKRFEICGEGREARCHEGRE